MARILDQEVKFDSLTGASEISFTIDTAGMNKKEIDKLFRANSPYEISNALFADNAICGWVEKPKKKKDPMAIKNVEFNPPLTIVIWEDGTKTFVKCGESDIYDPEKGLAMAIAKKAMGNKYNSVRVIDQWVDKRWTDDKNACVTIPTTDFIKEAIFEFPLDTYDYAVSDDILRHETVLVVKAKPENIGEINGKK